MPPAFAAVFPLICATWFVLGILFARYLQFQRKSVSGEDIVVRTKKGSQWVDLNFEKCGYGFRFHAMDAIKIALLLARGADRAAQRQPVDKNPQPEEPKKD